MIYGQPITFGGGAGGNELIVSAPAGSTVTATKNGVTKTASEINGTWIFSGMEAGEWTVTATLDGKSASTTVIVEAESVDLAYGPPLSSLAEGALVTLNENGSPVNFYVAKHDYESGLNGAGRTLLVRKEGYDLRQWSSINRNAYASSDLDAFLNGTYRALLDATVQEAIGLTNFYYTVGNGDTTKTTLSRAVFQPSLTELGKSKPSSATVNVEGTKLPIASTLAIAQIGGANKVQWTRTPDTSKITYVIFILAGGSANSGAGTATYASRPMFTLPADVSVNPEPNADGSYTVML